MKWSSRKPFNLERTLSISQIDVKTKSCLTFQPQTVGFCQKGIQLLSKLTKTFLTKRDISEDTKKGRLHKKYISYGMQCDAVCIKNVNFEKELKLKI